MSGTDDWLAGLERATGEVEGRGRPPSSAEVAEAVREAREGLYGGRGVRRVTAIEEGEVIHDDDHLIVRVPMSRWDFNKLRYDTIRMAIKILRGE